MTVPESRFRQVLGHLAAGVTLVTSRNAEGRPCGLTATAVCSVSLEPPLVLACIDRGTNTHAGIEGSGFYAVNLLGSGDAELAIRFSRTGEDKYLDLAVETRVTGAPILSGAVGFCDCSVERVVPAGDHTVFIGRVEAAEVLRPEEKEPLIYHLGRYRGVHPDPLEP